MLNRYVKSKLMFSSPSNTHPSLVQKSYFQTSFPSRAGIDLHFVLLTLKTSAKLTVDTEKHFFFFGQKHNFSSGGGMLSPKGKVARL